MPFTVTRNAVAYQVDVRSLNITFQDNGNLDSIAAVVAFPGPDGERQIARSITPARARAILAAAGLSNPQQTALLAALRTVVQEAILDHLDDSRQPPEPQP